MNRKTKIVVISDPCHGPGDGEFQGLLGVIIYEGPNDYIVKIWDGIVDNGYSRPYFSRHTIQHPKKYCEIIDTIDYTKDELKEIKSMEPLIERNDPYDHFRPYGWPWKKEK